VPVGDSERLDEVVQLADEELDRPEICTAVRIVRAAAVPELVLMDDRAAVGEVGEREEIVVRPARPSVQHDEWRRRVCVARSQVAGHAVPRLRFREGSGAFANVHARDSTLPV